MNKTTISTLSAALIFGLTGAAFAGGDKKASFESLDKNSDGYVERTEIPADHDLSSLFASYDTDRDSRLSSTEFNNYMGTEETEEAEE